MEYDFSRSADRSGAHSEKWSRRNIGNICGNADALPFWVADMDLATTVDITQALVREAERGVIGYRDDSALIPSFISFMKERHECTLSESEVSFAQGMLHAIALALNLFTKEGDGIALPFPSYHPFIDMVGANRRTLIPFHLKRTATGFELDTERWQKETEGAKAILFCSPHNPTGIVFDEGTLKMSENPALTKLFKENNGPDWEPLVEKGLIGKVESTNADAKIADSRESKPPMEFGFPEKIPGYDPDKPIHMPHLENFLGAVRGENKLNCDAEHAYAAEAVVFKAREASESGEKLAFQASDFVVED